MYDEACLSAERRQDPDGCLSVYEDFIHRGTTVSPRFKVLLATVLKEHGRDVPPQVRPKDLKDTTKLWNGELMTGVYTPCSLTLVCTDCDPEHVFFFVNAFQAC